MQAFISLVTIGGLAQCCLDTNFASIFEAAARWQDAGKLDPRFQASLRAGLLDLDRPLAKSPDLPRSGQEARRIRQAAGLPENFRHELLSLQFAELHVNHSPPSIITITLGAVISW